MKERILPRLYINDAQDSPPGATPFALQFSCWHARMNAYELSIDAIKRTKKDLRDIINRVFDVRKLDRFGARRGVVTTEDYGLIAIYSGEPKRLSTLLSLCSLRGSTAIADSLITEGADVDITDAKGNTPVHYALNEHMEYALTAYVSLQACLLVHRGARVDGKLEKNKQGPLVSLIRIHYLQHHGCIAAPSKWYSTLHRMNSDGAFDPRHLVPDTLSTIRYLIRAGVDVSPNTNDPRRLPLAHAIHCRDPKIVELLLAAGADPSPTFVVDGNREKYLFLTEAIYFSTPHIARILLEAGAALEESPGSAQEPPILALSCQVHREKEFIDVARSICQRIQDIDRPIKGNSALWWSLKTGTFQISKILLQNGSSWGSRGVFMRAKVVETLLTALLSNGTAHGTDADRGSSRRTSHLGL
ncbi:uncharacterized protein JN550_013874 [Neoarthrinium moseri]|uniref:uncharacterized protein n=1 Tax=Neoarthrinium moseri TaxID=1658444 RepID=UPI001FDB553C|nr:uncharacterized protein JN550_013874 [Neoarthrinium moseri]KAI1856296.1 hypothetical protein JN550_013874 [Neoarthrinium moseri]